MKTFNFKEFFSVSRIIEKSKTTFTLIKNKLVNSSRVTYQKIKSNKFNILKFLGVFFTVYVYVRMFDQFNQTSFNTYNERLLTQIVLFLILTFIVLIIYRNLLKSTIKYPAYSASIILLIFLTQLAIENYDQSIAFVAVISILAVILVLVIVSLFENLKEKKFKEES
ncbi:MAG: hypothetical protein Q9M91_04445 [Candidatus Dojkabacteria bacterium]|nr:hypothetical protein [Candidatus Dojkabacteria bacterium]